MQDLDFSRYDLEYAELLGVIWRQHADEIELSIRCPIRIWFLKKKLIKFAKSIGVKDWLDNPCIEYLLKLTFLGVKDINETLLSQGHTIGGYDPSSDWFRSIIFEIDDMRCANINNGWRFYLHAENLKLEFNYQDCILGGKCIE